ncbi:transposase [Frankia sp. CiP3]|uniref:IS66 family transposase n=1 Tax=Frankia sp. CiP3 TaxID=2880971 RepID=UPI002103DF3F|nr:transposase [Frankia sp. CiP3]
MDETPIRVGPRLPRPGRTQAKRHLLVACTDLYTHFLLGDRDLATFQTSVLAELAAGGATVVHDRYHLYDHDFFNPAARGPFADPTGDEGEHDPDDLDPRPGPPGLRPAPHQGLGRRRGDLPRRALARADRRRAARTDPPREPHPPHRRPRRPARPGSLPLLHPPAGPALPSVQELLGLFRDGVKVGLSATASHGTRPGERPARLLVEFLRDRHADVLRFLTDPAVPATSNDAERELRPAKLQQNISGRLSSETVTQDRYTILGYLRTAAKHGRDVMTTLREVMTGQAWIPGWPTAPA